MKHIFILIILLTNLVATTAQQITEIHYDNNGTDANERIEITVPTGTDITGWNIVLYNGLDGGTYDTDLVSSGTLTTMGGFDIYVISYPSNGIQNGAPDAVALVNASNVVLQFISYEGPLTATNGPANGTTSTDIIASENGTGTSSGSVQLNSVTGVWSTNTTQNSFGVLNATLLPIKLTSFTAINNVNSVGLNWNVALESGITTYELERSINGTNFTKITTVNAQNLASYTVIDNSPLTGNNYYRLKINENNGTFTYAIIQKVKVNGKALTINNIYPTPAINTINLTVQYTANAYATVNVVDITGKVVITDYVVVKKGTTNIPVQINALQPGIYIAKITVNGESTNEKFIKH